MRKAYFAVRASISLIYHYGALNDASSSLSNVSLEEKSACDFVGEPGSVLAAIGPGGCLVPDPRTIVNSQARTALLFTSMLPVPE